MKNLLLFFVWVLFIPVTLASQVKINEVLYNPSTGVDMIELKNFGSSAVDVSSWWFCSQISYNPISTMTAESGVKNIPAGKILVLSGKDFANNADLGLYTNNNNFAISSNMEDFVQWGSSLGSGGRESVAASKGIWDTGVFVAGVDQGHSIEYDGVGTGAGSWTDAATPSLGSENANATSVENPGSIPETFNLEQNFPNPFNPSTVINYTIPQSATLINTRLEIFNLLGQKVRTLVNTKQPSGTYTVQWNGRSDSGELLASGLYIYRLHAAEFVDMKKMLFMK